MKHRKDAPMPQQTVPGQSQPDGAAPEEMAPQAEQPAGQAQPDAQMAALQESLSQAENKRDEYLAMAQRVQADFDNYRRRNQNVRAEAFEDGAAAFIKTILPVCDNLERALAAPSSDEGLCTGVTMVYKLLLDTLEKRGVKQIARQGQPFDPVLEHAVAQGTAQDGEPGSVCEVLLKGYTLGDNVLRHAMVKVVPQQ